VNSRACEQPNQAKIEARHYINELLGANQTFPSHGENRGSSPLGSANDFRHLAEHLQEQRRRLPIFCLLFI
jgi:hypothetical protein